MNALPLRKAHTIMNGIASHRKTCFVYNPYIKYEHEMSNVYSYFCCCVCPSKRSAYNSTLSIQANVEFAKRKIGGLVFSKIWILNKNKIKSAQRTSNSYHSFEIWWSKILPVHSKRTKSISSSRLLVIFGCEFNFIHKRMCEEY